MQIPDVLPFIAPLSPLDLAALVFVALCWNVIDRMIENPEARRPSVSVLMVSYRREWLVHSMTREPRVYDAMMIGSLREGTAFFASATMIAIGGCIALIRNVDQLSGLAQNLSLGNMPLLLWDMKLMLVLFFVTNAFLKFVWSHRVFGYCSIMMAAMPNDAQDPMTRHRADQAAELNISAAKAFNRGLRSVYFAIGALTWVLGAMPLMLGTLATVAVLWRREFASNTRNTLMRHFP